MATDISSTMTKFLIYAIDGQIGPLGFVATQVGEVSFMKAAVNEANAMRYASSIADTYEKLYSHIEVHTEALRGKEPIRRRKKGIVRTEVDYITNGLYDQLTGVNLKIALSPVERPVEIDIDSPLHWLFRA